MRSQVTTKRGDKGRTVTISGEELSKSHPVIQCCGDLDALRAHTALCRLLILETDRDDANDLADSLFWLLHVYFLIGTECNDPKAKHPEYRKGQVSPEHLAKLEVDQEKLEGLVTLPKAFIVAASNTAAAQLDIVCTQARALERSVVVLKEAIPEFRADDILAFLNRLSDYFYLLARRLEDGDHLTVDYTRLAD